MIGRISPRVGGDAPRIVDCLEFNRDYRILEPIEDLACLALLDGYAALTGDEADRSLLALHMGCRGPLWAKLAIWYLAR